MMLSEEMRRLEMNTDWSVRSRARDYIFSILEQLVITLDMDMDAKPLWVQLRSSCRNAVLTDAHAMPPAMLVRLQLHATESLRRMRWERVCKWIRCPCSSLRNNVQQLSPSERIP